MRGLLAALALTAAFASGFAFDRWLHRPIVISFAPAPAHAHRGVSL